MPRASILLGVGFLAAASAQCSCTAGMPSTNAPFSAIAGDAGCAINYIEVYDASGAAILLSGNASSRVGPFEISCPGSLITSFVRVRAPAVLALGPLLPLPFLSHARRSPSSATTAATPARQPPSSPSATCSVPTGSPHMSMGSTTRAARRLAPFTLRRALVRAQRALAARAPPAVRTSVHSRTALLARSRSTRRGPCSATTPRTAR